MWHIIEYIWGFFAALAPALGLGLAGFGHHSLGNTVWARFFFIGAAILLLLGLIFLRFVQR